MNTETPLPAEAYLLLRSYILSLDPLELNLAPTQDAPHIWGVVMETGYPVGSATLIALADGTISLYISTGGGMLGRADYPPLAQAARAMVMEAENQLEQMQPTDELPLPEVGLVRFTLLTYTGRLTAEAPEKKLSKGKHALSALYTLAQAALEQLRVSADKKHRSA